MHTYHMTAESALSVITALDSQGVRACVGGGWAVDALLGEQTREHSTSTSGCRPPISTR